MQLHSLALPGNTNSVAEIGKHRGVVGLFSSAQSTRLDFMEISGGKLKEK